MVIRTCLSWAFVKFCACPSHASFPFGIEGGMWHVIVLIPDNCLSIFFPLSRMTTNNEIRPMKFAIIRVLPFLNNPKDLDPSYKTGLDFFLLFWKDKNSIL